MDLEEYNDDLVLNTLIEVAKNINEDSIILDSCGESIGSLWVQRNTFDKIVYDSLAQDAQNGIYFVIENRKPEWITQWDIK